MFGWWSSWRRKRLLAAAEPTELRRTLDGDLWQWRFLPEDVQEASVQWLRIFCHEKYWEGCNGFQLHDYHRWIIAAQASLMTLGMPELQFSGCQTLLIYPSHYVAPGITHMIDSQIGIHGEQHAVVKHPIEDQSSSIGLAFNKPPAATTTGIVSPFTSWLIN